MNVLLHKRISRCYFNGTTFALYIEFANKILTKLLHFPVERNNCVILRTQCEWMMHATHLTTNCMTWSTLLLNHSWRKRLIIGRYGGLSPVIDMFGTSWKIKIGVVIGFIIEFQRLKPLFICPFGSMYFIEAAYPSNNIWKLKIKTEQFNDNNNLYK